MHCPACDWTSVSYAIESRQWSCKRCRHTWSERSSPGSKMLFAAPKSAAATKAKPKKKSLPAKAKKRPAPKKAAKKRR